MKNEKHLKKALIISYFLDRNISVGAIRIQQVIQHLISLNYSVTILCENIDTEFELKLENQKVLKIASWRKVAKDKISSSNSTFSFLKYFKNFLLKRGIPIIGRMPDGLNSWRKKSLRTINSDQAYDLIFSTYAPYSNHLIAQKVKNNNPSSFWIADFRDPWTFHHFFKGLKILSFLEKHIEKKVFKTSDLILTANSNITDHYKNLYPLALVSTLENGIDSSFLHKYDKLPALKNSPNLIIHAGTIYSKFQNIKPFLEALSHSNNIYPIHFIGLNNPTANIIEDHHTAFKHMTFISKLNENNLLSYYKSSSYLLFFDYDHCQYVTSKKLYEYCATGKVILFITNHKNSTCANIAQKYGNVKFIENNSIAISEALTNLPSPKASNDHNLENIYFDTNLNKFLKKYHLT